MEANDQRQYVTDRWEWVQVRLAEPYEGVAEGKWIVRLPLLPFSQIGFDSESEALQAASDFTRQREEEIERRRRIASSCLRFAIPRSLVSKAWQIGILLSLASRPHLLIFGEAGRSTRYERAGIRIYQGSAKMVCGMWDLDDPSVDTILNLFCRDSEMAAGPF